MRILLCLFLLLPFTFLSQKKVLDHTVFNDWKRIENHIISKDGKFVSYTIVPHRGDGYLYIHNVETGKTDSIFRGKDAQFSPLSDALVFRITPGFDTLRNCELNKVDKKKWPKDSLGIYLMKKDTLIKVAKLKTFKFSEESNLLAYTIDDNKLPETKSSTKKKKKKKEPTEKEYKSDGNVLTFFDPITLKEHKFKDVTDFILDKKGESFALITHRKEKADSFRLVFYAQMNAIPYFFPNKTSYKGVSFSEDAKHLIYMPSADTNKVKQYELQLFNIANRNSISIADTSSHLLPEGKSISENYTPLFTENGKYLFFGVADIVVPEPKDTLLESEKVKVDIWHYLDDRLQPQQLKQLKYDQKKTHLYAYDMVSGTIAGLTNDTLSGRVSKNIYGDYFMAVSEEQYAVENNWDTPGREDHYRVSLLDGKSQLLNKAVRQGGELSPSGRYYAWFHSDKNNFYMKDINSGEEFCLTCDAKDVIWVSDENGVPALPYPLGILGYSDQEKAVWIQSEYDIWTFDLASKKLLCLTNGEGKSNKIKLTLKKWDSDSIFLNPENLILEGFNEKTKGAHLYSLMDHGDHMDLVERMITDHKIITLQKAKENDLVILRKMNVTDYPEITLTNTTFDNQKVISKTNPQQSEYNWATAELVKWKSYSGIELEGLLYKPEDYDPSKSYPMIVYFYELYSDNLHNHYTPKPTASIVFPTEYASSGYFIFIPDIRYKPGKPAQSAYDCIMSGTDHVLKTYPAVDAKRLGLQGQSWGGYQTAQLITMTDRYAAAMAGAPVANMFSAYGGIRWGSGVNRQFQYERGQSRIGKTIWEAPDLYIENSPLFHLPKVKTPLLIMHNDEDGAVPWYQGIELYTGLRRLSKPVWMLNYNGDDHNLMKNANRIDLSIRMKQFFDHYLLNTPAPLWLSDGIPALDKGKVTGY